MLVDFSVANYLSIKEPLTFSMISKDYKSNVVDLLRVRDDLSLIPVATIYGFNASGKSNLIKGITEFRKMIVYSKIPDLNLLGIKPFEYFPYKLDDKLLKEPTSFRIRVCLDGDIYIYSVDYDQYSIQYEELSILFSNEDSFFTVYTRDYSDVEPFFDVDINTATKIVGTDPDKKLYIGALSLFDKYIQKFVNWIENDLVVIPHDFSSRDYLSKTTEYLFNKDLKFQKSLLKMLDDIAYSNIVDIKAEKITDSIEYEDLPNSIKDKIKRELITNRSNSAVGIKGEYTLNTLKEGVDDDGKERSVVFNINEESEGTLKIYALYSFVYEALNLKKTLIIDEMTSFIHPLISSYIIEQFQTSDVNKGGQLISTTHTTDLLEIESLRKDQVYITDKLNNETSIYSLSDIQNVSEEEDFRRAYLAGKYGGINYFRRGLNE